MKELSDKEVLEAAIDRAIDSGLPMRYVKLKSFKRYEIETDGYTEDSPIYGYIRQISSGEPRYEWEWFSYEELLFNHEFCKALFGTASTCSYCGVQDNKHDPYCEQQDSIEAWQYHGTQMFLAEDRVDYLRRHLNE